MEDMSGVRKDIGHIFTALSSINTSKATAKTNSGTAQKFTSTDMHAKSVSHQNTMSYIVNVCISLLHTPRPLFKLYLDSIAATVLSGKSANFEISQSQYTMIRSMLQWNCLDDLPLRIQSQPSSVSSVPRGVLASTLLEFLTISTSTTDERFPSYQWVKSRADLMDVGVSETTDSLANLTFPDNQKRIHDLFVSVLSDKCFDFVTSYSNRAISAAYEFSMGVPREGQYTSKQRTVSLESAKRYYKPANSCFYDLMMSQIMEYLKSDDIEILCLKYHDDPTVTTQYKSTTSQNDMLVFEFENMRASNFNQFTRFAYHSAVYTCGGSIEHMLQAFPKNMRDIISIDDDSVTDAIQSYMTCGLGPNLPHFLTMPLILRVKYGQSLQAISMWLPVIENCVRDDWKYAHFLVNPQFLTRFIKIVELWEEHVSRITERIRAKRAAKGTDKLSLSDFTYTQPSADEYDEIHEDDDPKAEVTTENAQNDDDVYNEDIDALGSYGVFNLPFSESPVPTTKDTILNSAILSGKLSDDMECDDSSQNPELITNGRNENVLSYALLFEYYIFDVITMLPIIQNSLEFLRTKQSELTILSQKRKSSSSTGTTSIKRPRTHYDNDE